LSLELDHGRTARRYQSSLHVSQRRAGQGSLVIYPVEDLANHMEAGYQVGAADTEEDAHGFVNVGFHLVGGRQGIHGAVEHHVFGTLVEQLVQRELLQASRAVTLRGIELALHHIVLAVHFAQAALRLDQNHAVHAVGDVLGDHGGSAVVNIQAGSHGFEREALGMAGSNLSYRSTTTGASHGMEVDRVDMGAVLGVFQVDVHSVAHTYPQHRARYGVVEGPELVARTIAQTTFHFSGFKVNSKFLGSTLADWLTHFTGVLGQVRELTARFFLGITHDQLAEHTRCLVPGQAAQVLVDTTLVRPEHDRGRRALAANLIGFDIEIGN